MSISWPTFITLLAFAAGLGAFIALNAVGRVDKLIAALKGPDEDKLENAERQASALSAENKEYQAAIKRLEADAAKANASKQYDLTTATHLGEVVDAFRVYYTKTHKSYASYERDYVSETEVGYTDDPAAAREYVRTYISPAEDGFFPTWGRTYHVEAVSMFKLPSGELVKPKPFTVALVLPPVNDHAVLSAEEEE